MPLPQIPEKSDLKNYTNIEKEFIYLKTIFSYLDKRIMFFYLKNDPIFLFNQINRRNLLHRLSKNTIEFPVLSGLKNTSLDEFHVCLKNKDSFLDHTTSIDSFLIYIQKISYDISGIRENIRETDVIVTPNENGDFVIYPEYKYIRYGISLVIYVIKNRYKFGDLLSASMVLSILLSTHPLKDCNGRVSRIIFNIFIINFISKNLFIPLLELSRVTNNGFLLNIKESQMLNQWAGIGNYINKSIYEILLFNTKKEHSHRAINNNFMYDN